MGYNGSNRKGYDRRYRGLSKSSMRFGNSLLFGKRGLISGLFDIGSSVISDTSKISLDNKQRKGSCKSQYCAFIVSLLFVIALTYWGIYWINLPYGYSLLVSLGWLILLFAGIMTLGLLFIIKSLFDEIVYRKGKSKKEQDSETKFLPQKEIDPKFQERLLDNFGLECYFHFTRRLLSEEDYNKIEFSTTFKKMFYLYEGYKKMWESKYWHYSFEKKIHKILIGLLSEDFINGENEVDELRFYNILYDRMMKETNQYEKRYYTIVQRNGCSMKTFLNWYNYKKLWMINKYEPHLIQDELKKDMIDRQESCMHNTYLLYGGVWNASYPFIVAQFERNNDCDWLKSIEDGND